MISSIAYRTLHVKLFVKSNIFGSIYISVFLKKAAAVVVVAVIVLYLDSKNSSEIYEQIKLT